ncbi:MAG TPA: sel1 repeat family protein [Campylobacterales bacterium]|nr:sel1 repeat family protein [Campylobacterales bacterium]
MPLNGIKERDRTMKKIIFTLLMAFSTQLFANTNLILKNKCLNNDALACYELGLPLVQGDNEKVQTNLEEGMAYIRKACTHGEERACDIMGERYYKDKNYRFAVKYLTDSCDRGIKTACESLGVIYRDAHIGKQDDVKAREFFTKACELKSGDACYNVAIMYRGGFGVDKNRTEEKKYYQKGCDAGLKAGCDRFTELDNEDKGIETGIMATIKDWFK